MPPRLRRGGKKALSSTEKFIRYIKNNNTEGMKQEINKGLNPNKKINELHPIAHAIVAGSVDAMELICQHLPAYGEPHWIDPDAVLILAIASKNVNIIASLMRYDWLDGFDTELVDEAMAIINA